LDLSKNNKISFILVGILLVLCSGVFREVIQTKDWLVNHQVNHFKEEIAKVDIRLGNELNRYLNIIDTNSFEVLLKNGVEYHRNLEKDGYGVYLYEDNNLKFWSSHKYIIPKKSVENGFIQEKNGFYLYKKIEKDGITIIGQYLIKKNYRFENSYVTNSFQDELYLGGDWLVSKTSFNESIEVSIEGDSLYILPQEAYLPPVNKYLIITEILGLLLFGLGIVLFALDCNVKLKLFGILPFVVFVRFLLWYLKLPTNLHELDVFQPQILAFSKWIPSLGDLVLNVFFVLVLIISVLRGVKFKPKHFKPVYYVVNIFLLVILYLLSWAVIETIEGMVMNSEIPLDLSNILLIKSSTIIALFCVSGILGTYVFVAWKFINFLKQIGIEFQKFILILLFFYVIVSVLTGLFGFSDVLDLLWGILVLSLLSYSIYEQNRKINFSLSVSLLFVFSMIVTHALRDYASKKDVIEGKVLLRKLSQNKDLIAEYLFDDLGNRISENKELKALLINDNTSDQELYKYIKQHYFNGFWEKYDLQVNPCFKGDSIQLINGSDKIECSAFFEDIIAQDGEQVTDNFYFLENNNGRISYLGRVKFPSGEKIYFEFDSKFKPEGLGFPILLLDKQIERRSLDVAYSFAMYKDGVLSKQKGVYNFSTSLDYYLEPSSEWERVEKNGVEHLVFSRENTTYLLSKKITGTWDQMAFYSYLFAFFSIVMVVGTVLFKIIYRHELFTGSFKSRFQGLIVFILFFSTVFIGLGSVYYLKNQYNEKNFDAISEKIQSVKIEVEHKLGKQDSLGEDDLEYIQIILEKFSGVFFTDINLFDPNGELISSSQPKIFDEGLLGKRMDPLAMYQMLYNSHSQFVQIEEIEGMQYLSAYVPFYNIRGELLAYLNLPYFARSNDLKDEISNFLVALLNIYALLIVVALVIALIITNKITEPLIIIQEKMAGIQLGKKNELINYSGKDEIGKLINEYNRMVVEIAESAQRFAESEREDAWREMAKQVAHEIKNPLTPMKLSIQHLQMRWDTMTAGEKEERFVNFSKNLVEQIDTLSAIASEFSSFAKLKDANFSEVDLMSLINSSVGVYDGTNDISVSCDCDIDYRILGDKDQILRVFNNLIKNAIQAIPKNREGKVMVSLMEEEAFILVSVLDNGSGISRENQDKIFVPNFTTKNSGMGLGLAMVQKIIENMSGDISFKTTPDVGTEFVLKFPLIK
jgi:signal transduction histidine kinase